MNIEKIKIQLNNLRERLNEFADVLGNALGIDDFVDPEDPIDSS